jgi:adenylate cyclase
LTDPPPPPCGGSRPDGGRAGPAARPERRLAAILAADVAGYSRLVERDEQGTLERLRAHRKELVEPLLAAHRGRIVKLMGDGALCEFASVVDAVACAVAIQDGMAERERGVPEGERIRLRIGINLGDLVVEEDGDLYGDGVNVAARLEQLAEPGGVLVSGTAHDQLRGKSGPPLEFAGERRLKNMAEPVRTYRVRLGGGPVRPGARARPRLARRAVWGAAACLLAAAAAVGGWWFAGAPPGDGARVPGAVTRGPAPPFAGAQTAPATTTAPRMSVVVLPFANLGGDPEQEYFADGITDDLTADLSRIDGSFVIARQTAFTYKGRPVDMREVGRELGVRYALQGSVRRAGDRVTINAQLVDASSGASLWAERFEGKRGDLAALQDRVTGGVAGTLRLELVRAEARRLERDRATDPDALDDAMRGWAVYHRPFSREGREEARRLFERALAKDPDAVDALVGLAQVLAANTLEGWSAEPDEDRARADALLRRALDLEPNRAATHFVLGVLRRSQGRLDEAAEALRAAIALDRNYARAYLQLGFALTFMGRPDEAIALARQSQRLNPRDPNASTHLWLLGYAHLLLGRAEESVGFLEKARASNPRLYYVHLYLAAALGLAGRVEEARQALAESLRLKPDYDTLERVRAGSPGTRHPDHVELAERTVHVGLRRAGMPDA